MQAFWSNRWRGSLVSRRTASKCIYFQQNPTLGRPGFPRGVAIRGWVTSVVLSTGSLPTAKQKTRPTPRGRSRQLANAERDLKRCRNGRIRCCCVEISLLLNSREPATKLLIAQAFVADQWLILAPYSVNSNTAGYFSQTVPRRLMRRIRAQNIARHAKNISLEYRLSEKSRGSARFQPPVGSCNVISQT
jgi:hypothetical protein